MTSPRRPTGFKFDGDEMCGNGARRTDASLANQLESSRGGPQAWTPGSLSAIHKAVSVKTAIAAKNQNRPFRGGRRDRRRLHRGRKTTMHDDTRDDSTEQSSDRQGNQDRRRGRITGRHLPPQVLVRVFWGCSGGREGTLPPLELPFANVYNIEPTLKGVVPSV